jgi:hypothetical protein
MTTTLTKILSVFFTLILSLCPIVTSFAAVGQTNVTFVCKVDENIETDDYSPVVVTLMNEDTFEKSSYTLYKYNSFSERYLMDNGTYTIIDARIDNRNDIIFEWDADYSFAIGQIKTIYLELYDSNLIVTDAPKTTTKPTTTTTTTDSSKTITELTTEPKTLYTLYNPSTKPTETEQDISTNETSDTKITTEVVDDITSSTTTTKVSTTKDISEVIEEDNEKSAFKIIVIIAALLVLLVISFVIAIKIRKER